MRGVGNERGCRRLLIEPEKEGDRGVMAWIEGSPELLRRDGRGRDSGKKGRKGERGSVGGDTDVRVPHVSGWKRKKTVRWGLASGAGV